MRLKQDCCTLFYLITSLLLISCDSGSSSVPAAPSPDTKIISTASYKNTSCAIKAISSGVKGQLSCWGQIPDIVITDTVTGSGSVNYRTQSSPLLMSADSNWIKIVIGRDHMCGIKSLDSGNRLYCMGWNYNGQMGLPRLRYQDIASNTKYNTRNFYASMTQIGSTTDWISLAAAYDHTCGIFGVGNLKCWGANRYGVLAQNGLDPANFNSLFIYDDLDSQNAGNKIRSVLSADSTPATGTWIKVSTNKYTTCAIKADNTLWCWGRNDFNHLGLAATPVVTHKQFVTAVTTPATGFNAATDRWIDISVGSTHSCAIATTQTAVGIPNMGKLWCWGDNAHNEVDQNNTATIALPDVIPVSSNSNWTSVSSSTYYSCALNELGEVFCWGYYAAVPFVGDVFTLTAIVGPNKNWSAITTGIGHGCAVKSTNIGATGDTEQSQLYCWGQQQFAQLGTGFSYNSYIPNLIANDNKPLSDPYVWQQLATGAYHSCGIKNDMSLWCWGDNYLGRLGLGYNLPTVTPQRISHTNVWLQVNSYFQTTCGLVRDGTVWCWGKNGDGQIGDDTLFRSNKPVLVTANSVATIWDSTTVGKYFSCARKIDKTLWCWGENQYGQLGVPATSAQIAGKKQITRLWQKDKIFAGYRGICALEDVTGDLYCWGRNHRKQIQNSATLALATPIKITVPEPGLNWLSARVGRGYICAIAGISPNASVGSLWCWGDNRYGTLANEIHYSQIDYSTAVTLAATRINSVASPFKVNIPGTALGDQSQWRQVTVHDENVCAIKADGSLWCWGDNYHGEHGVGHRVLSAKPVQEKTQSKSWYSVKNGDNHTCGLQSLAGKLDKSLWCWGGKANQRQIGDIRLVDLQVKLVQ